MDSSNKQLIVIQPTPFCNINCKYCYLPERSNTERISIPILEELFSQIFSSNKFEDSLNIVWHAGEPLTVPVDFYITAFDLAKKIAVSNGRNFRMAFQTNATLINSNWIKFFKEYEVNIGVSVDGPDFIHNFNRVTRRGIGTFAKVKEGIKQLQEAEIQFNVISVLTAQSLNYPNEMFDFYVSNNIKAVGFNIDEIEGVNSDSSFSDSENLSKYKIFVGKFLQNLNSYKEKLVVREFKGIAQQIFMGNYEGDIQNSTNIPLKILNVDFKGNFSTFCPELIGTNSSKYSNFVMGNILTDKVDELFSNPVFQLVNAEVQRGVEMCRSTCEYWQFCGGGAPANKFFEHGKFDVTETLACRIHKKVLTDVIIDHMQQTLNSK